jgi:hypothetical protein
VGGELPIPVFAAARVGLGIGVTFDGDMAGKLSQFLRQQGELRFTVVTWGRSCQFEKKVSVSLSSSSIRSPSGGNGHFDLIFNLVEVRNLSDGLLQFLLQFRHVVFGDGKGLGNAHFRGTDLRGGSRGILEIASNSFPHGLMGVKQPENNEERYGGGEEFSVVFPGL